MSQQATIRQIAKAKTTSQRDYKLPSGLYLVRSCHPDGVVLGYLYSILRPDGVVLGTLLSVL